MPRDRKLEGYLWVNHVTGQPERFVGRWVDPPFYMDRFELQVEYGVAETGQPQIREVLTDGEGKLAFGVVLARKRYRVRIQFDHYEPGASDKP